MLQLFIRTSAGTLIVGRVFDILVGDHYHIVDPNYYSPPTSKGVLDFLIFPLISRALILGTESRIARIAGLAIAIPLEVARFSLGIALTLLLAPVAALIDVIQNCLARKDVENSASVGPIAGR